MEPATLIVSASLLLFSAALVFGHIRTRRAEWAILDGDSPAGQFAKRRFLRRIQASAMIGIAGLAILISPWLPKDPLFFACYWLGVVLWVLWIALLALADALATRHHFGKIQHDDFVERARLRADLAQLERQDNGHTKEVHEN